jgi:hypothetical protein
VKGAFTLSRGCWNLNFEQAPATTASECNAAHCTSRDFHMHFNTLAQKKGLTLSNTYSPERTDQITARQEQKQPNFTTAYNQPHTPTSRPRLALTGSRPRLRHITPSESPTGRSRIISPTRNTKEAMPPPPPPPQLPYELWLCILKSLSHEDHFARPAYVNCFVTAILRNNAQID